MSIKYTGNIKFSKTKSDPAAAVIYVSENPKLVNYVNRFSELAIVMPEDKPYCKDWDGEDLFLENSNHQLLMDPDTQPGDILLQMIDKAVMDRGGNVTGPAFYHVYSIMMQADGRIPNLVRFTISMADAI